MKLLLTLLILAGTGCSARDNEPATEFNGQLAKALVDTMVAFGPRVPNTPGHQRTGDWILARLSNWADTVEVQEFSHVTRDGDTLNLRNFLARFRPNSPNRVLYLAHWDTRPRADESANLGDQQVPVPGANDGASGTALLLGVAEALSRTPPDLGVDLLLVDGEDYGDFGEGSDVLLGSKYFAGQLPESYQPLLAVLFDMVGDRNLTIFQESYSVRAAPEVVDRVWRRAEELGYGQVFRPSVGYSVVDDHVPLIERGIRAIVVIDFEYEFWHTQEDTPDKVSAESLQIVGNVAMSLLR